MGIAGTKISGLTAGTPPQGGDTFVARRGAGDVRLSHKEITNALVFSVKNYNAMGDGVTDDSGAIQNAINDAATVNGRVVFPVGTYRLATGLVLQPTNPSVVSPRVDFIGVSPTASVLKGDAGVSCLTLICGSGGLTDVHIDGLGFNGGANGIVVSDLAPYNWGLTHSKFSHLMIFSMTGAGILINSQEILEVTFEHVDAEQCDYGGNISCSLCANVVTFHNCQWRENTTCGLYLGENLGTVVLINNLCESNYKTGLKLSGPNIVRLIGGWFENNSRNMSGGPYYACVLSTSFVCNGVIFQNTVFNVGPNDNGIAVQVASTNIAGYVAFERCLMGTQKVDVGAWGTKPHLVFRDMATPTIVGTSAGTINYGMSDISVPGGINVGTATGAGAGQIKTSAAILAGGAALGMLGVLNDVAANDATTLIATVSGGADGTLGPMIMGLYIHPSATGANRYAEISAADNVNWRNLVLARQGGNVGVGQIPTTTLDVNGTFRINTATPASSGAAGVAGQIAWDASYIYVCTATNTWKRVAIATW